MSTPSWITEDLKRSGLSVKDVDIKSYTAEQTEELCGFRLESYAIPYYDINNKKSTFFRLKLRLEIDNDDRPEKPKPRNGGDNSNVGRSGRRVAPRKKVRSPTKANTKRTKDSNRRTTVNRTSRVGKGFGRKNRS